MGIEDKVSSAADDVKGKAKEAAGEATGDKNLKADGLIDQGKATLKEGAGKVKDAVQDGVADAKEAAAEKFNEATERLK